MELNVSENTQPQQTLTDQKPITGPTWTLDMVFPHNKDHVKRVAFVQRVCFFFAA